MALTAKSLATLPEGRHGDGRYGLYFNVIGNSRSWVQRLVINGKRRNHGLGPWPVVSLREAREVAFENVRMRHRGMDPFAKTAPTRTVPTFAEAADTYIKLQAAGWKRGSRNEANWRSSLTHAKRLDAMPVDTIEAADVAAVVTRQIEAGKLPLARSLRQRIEKVMGWCIASGHRAGPNPGNGDVAELIPTVAHKVEHRESVPPGEIAEVLAKVEAVAAESPTWRGQCAAFRFVVLTACRTSEAIGARFDEIDFDAATWTVPASRMKAGKAHRVPLSDAALTVLRAQRERHGAGGLVFKSPRGKRLDVASLRKLAKRVQMAGTVHGFRGAFKSWCMEQGVDRAVAEYSLAHTFMSDTEAAYVRTDLLGQRRPIMSKWSEFVTAGVAGN